MNEREPVAITTSGCNCKPGYVCLVHAGDWPNGAPSCDGCGEKLDPVLWQHGLHLGCEAPQTCANPFCEDVRCQGCEAAPTLATIAANYVPPARAAFPCDDPFCGPGGCGYRPNEHMQHRGPQAIIAADMARAAERFDPRADSDTYVHPDALSSAPVAPSPAPSPFVRPAGPPPAHPLKAELIEMVRWAAANDPRSLQTNIGPSEVGSECTRRLAYRFKRTPQVNTTADPWFSVIGRAAHEWLDTAINDYQIKRLGVPAVGSGQFRDGRRYLTEQRVRIEGDQFGVGGSCDLYDVQRQAVVDHKVVGATALKKYRDTGPSSVYRTQVHLYGLGHEQAGRPVREVAIAFYPRSGYLTDLHVWAEPYDRQVALDALNRANTIKTLAALLPVGSIPAAPDPVGCTWCPFYRPGGPADETGCPGATVQNGA